ncbi:Putative molybdenum transport ATP-binding protein modF [Olavius sp. associated proteobacterium Delta 1]|nr:Putative molybdenum transport ATP-binding protein modF [Olavius sp. associated proteobacterium Delta 1]
MINTPDKAVPPAGPANPTIVRLENVTLRVRETLLLANTSWRIDKGQHWAIIGPNGAGKTSLVKALTGDVPVVKGAVFPTHDQADAVRAEYVSFEQHQRLIAREEQRDEFRFFSGNLNRITTVHDILSEIDGPAGLKRTDVGAVVARLKINHLLGRGIRALSTGEMRKVQIARVLLKSPEIMILDEPFDGLDESSRQDLARIIDDLMNDTRTVILVTHRQREILPNISHVLAIRDGQVIIQGQRDDILTSPQMEYLYAHEFATSLTIPTTEGMPKGNADTAPEILIRMNHVTVKYDSMTVLDNVSWTMRTGQNWVILGPNGSGKTTLLNLITADNLQAYANEIYLFGRRRGSGESIWDIKERIGMMSSEFQIRYRKPLSAFEVVLSGFFDSVGLFRNASPDQKQTADQWLAVLGIADKSVKIFNQLSYGEQRMILLARSMVKMPQILILDEPYQGLDRTNRQRILDAIDVIGLHSGTDILYVTHYPAEIPACMTHMLRFEKTPSGKYVASQRAM